MNEEIQYFNAKDIKTESFMLIGKRWLSINEYIDNNKIDLLVLGTHGIRSKKGELLLGTTSHKLIFTSSCPVFLVRA